MVVPNRGLEWKQMRHESRWFISGNYWCHNLLIQHEGGEKRKTGLKLISCPPSRHKAFTTDLDTSSVSERCLTVGSLTVGSVYLTTPGYAGWLCTTGYPLIIRLYTPKAAEVFSSAFMFIKNNDDYTWPEEVTAQNDITTNLLWKQSELLTDPFHQS